jgi:preprotein translocase subunit SecE
MAMNREQKRMLQKQGAIQADGSPTVTRKPPPAPRPKEQRTKFRQFLRESRAEMRKVNWPTRSETINYSIIVFVTVIMLTAMIAGADYVLAKAVLWIYDA